MKIPALGILFLVLWLAGWLPVWGQNRLSNGFPERITINRMASPPMRTNVGVSAVPVPRPSSPATNAPPAATPPARPAQPTDILQDLMMTQPSIDVDSPVIVTGQFEPQRVNRGERLTYRLEISALNESIQLPDRLPVPSPLIATLSGRGQYFSNDGTRLKPRTSVNYRVSTPTPGNFVMPGFSMVVYGKTVQVPAAQVTIVDAPTASVRDQPRVITELPEGEVYIGQSLPVRVMLVFPLTTNILGVTQVQAVGEAFMSDPSVVRLRREMISYEGKNWNAFICDLVVTPIYQGTHRLISQLHAIVNPAVQNQPGAFTMNQVLMDGDPVNVTVKSLPKEGELPGFTGGIGLFQLDPPQLSAAEVRVGDPVTLTVTIKGLGNINRLVPPRVTRAPNWQVFPPLSDSFSPPAPANQPGTRVLNFTLIPLSDTVQGTPAIPFCYFNPQTKTYVDLSVPPVKIKVTPAPGGANRIAATAQNTATVVNPYPAPASEEEFNLTGLAEKPGRRAATLKPLQQRTGFLLMQLIPAGLLSGLWWWDRRRRYLAEHPELILKRRARRGLRRQVQRLRQASARRDLPAFIGAAVNGLQEACAPQSAANPTALVANDVLQTLATGEFQRPDHEAVNRIFAARDRLRFHHSDTAPDTLFELQPALESILAKLRARL